MFDSNASSFDGQLHCDEFRPTSYLDHVDAPPDYAEWLDGLGHEHPDFYPDECPELPDTVYYEPDPADEAWLAQRVRDERCHADPDEGWSARWISSQRERDAEELALLISQRHDCRFQPASLAALDARVAQLMTGGAR